jgi:uncharacterized repeat protein (TIGR01451 family)
MSAAPWQDRHKLRAGFSWFCSGFLALLLAVPQAWGDVSFTDINPDSSTLDATDPDGASGGRINGLASVANSNQVFYAATEWGGLYQSVDGGLTWSRLDGHLPVATWDVAVDPVTANTVYATSFYDGRVAPISGIQVSYDAGATWTHPPTAHPDPALEGTPDDNTPDPGFSCLNAARRTEPSAFGIGIRPDAPANVFIGTNCGVAISDDSGATWRFVDPSPGDPADDVWDVVVQAGGPTGQGIIDVCGDDGHSRSTDGGNTWVQGTGLPGGLCSIAASPDEPYVLLVAASDSNFYESDNANAATGSTWANLGTPDSRRQGRIPFVVTNDRAGTAFDLWYGDVSLFRGGCTTPATPAPGGVNRCPAGAVTPASPPPAGWAGPFTRAGTVPAPPAQAAHDDAGDLVFDTSAATDACPVIFSSDGGVYRNTNLGAGCHTPSWEQPNVTPHALWIYGMDGADQPGDTNEDLYFGTQDDGTFASTDGGAPNPTWFNRDCCDSFDIVADATRVVSSLCCGFSVRVSNPGMVGTTPIATNPPGGVPAFNFPDFIERFGNNQYAAVTGTGAFITNDITVNPVVWTQLGAASTPAGGFCAVHAAVPPAGVPTFYGQTFCVTSTNSIVEIAGSAQLWRYDGTNPAGTWTRVDNNGLTGGFGVVAVAPNDPNRLYASNLAPAGPQMVFSTDGGATWNNDAALDALMTGGGAFRYRPQRGPTPQPQFNGYPQPSLLAFDPGNANVIVAGGRDSGVFLSIDGGQNWVLLTDPLDSGNSGIPHLPRPWFAYFDREPTDIPGEVNFYVGTQGRGVWRISVTSADLVIAKADNPDPVPAGGLLLYTLTVTNNGPGAAGKVVVTDTLPAGVSHVSNDGGCTPEDSVVRCEIGNLAPSATKTIQITVKVDDLLVDNTGSAVISNEATVSSSSTPDPDTSNNTAVQETTVLPGCGGVFATIVGTPGDDNILDTAADDVIATLAGDDSVVAIRGGDDAICVGGGDDNVIALRGNNKIDAGPGDDKTAAGPGDDVITAGDGDDVINAGAGDDTIDAGPGDDHVNAGSGSDAIDAGPGNDNIGAGPGDDAIDAGAGDDNIVAGGGDDGIDAGAGDDTVGGNPGDDTIDAGPGDDNIDAGPGNDLIDGGPGTDTCVNGEVVAGCE